MRPLFVRLIRKEVLELVRNPWTFCMLFAVPVLLLVAVGNFTDASSEVRVVMISENVENSQSIKRAERILSEITNLQIARSDASNALGQSMSQAQADIAIVFGEDGQRFYERSATRFRNRNNVQLIQQIRHVMEHDEPWYTPAVRSAVNKESIGTRVFSLTLLPPTDNRALIPTMLALIIVLLPAVLAVRSFLREVGNSTIQMLLSLSGSSWHIIAAAKLFVAMLVSLAVLCFVLLCSVQLFGFFVKPGLLMVFAAQMIAMFAVATLVLSVAILTLDAIQSYLFLAFYIFCNIIFTGVMVEIGSDATYNFYISQLLPLTFSRVILEEWMFYGSPALWQMERIGLLLVHFVIGAVALAASLYRVRMRV